MSEHTVEVDADLTEAEHEQLRTAYSEWATEDEYPRPPQFTRIVVAVGRILAGRKVAHQLYPADPCWCGANHWDPGQ